MSFLATSLRRSFVGALPILFLAACSGEQPNVQTPGATGTTGSDTASAAPSTSATEVASASTSSVMEAPAPKGQGHALVVAAAACWFGGLWGDALGEAADARKAGDEARCKEVVRRAHGGEDAARYERLRAVEEAEVADLKAKVADLTKTDPDEAAKKDTLVKLLDALALGQRENALARRAADKVKRDLKDDKEPSKLSKDEVDAVAPLRAHAGIAGLLGVTGDLGAEAHALGVMLALDRMEVAHGLPKHLKVYAVGDTNALVLGVKAPDVPDDATKPLKPGTWLGYLTDVAKSAGHAVPDKLKKPAEREPHAWAGTLDAFADQLRKDVDKLPAGTDLQKVTSVVIKRLDDELAKVAAQPPAADKKPADKKAPSKKK